MKKEIRYLADIIIGMGNLVLSQLFKSSVLSFVALLVALSCLIDSMILAYKISNPQ